MISLAAPLGLHLITNRHRVPEGQSLPSDTISMPFGTADAMPTVPASGQSLSRTFPYEFKTPIVPGRVSFRPRHDDGCGATGYWCGATKWQFIGTNDATCGENSAWTVLCEDLSGRHFERMRQSKYCTVEKRMKKFKCLGISVLDSSYEGGYSCVSMSGIRMWQRIE